VAPPPSDAKDVRFRPFRLAAFATYMVAVVAFSSLVIVSVVGSVLRMTPSHRPAAETTLSTRECAQIAERLWRELDDERRALSTRNPVQGSDHEWTRFRVAWLGRLRDAESRCGADSRSRPGLSSVFRRLDRLMDLYTTHAVQYAGEIGPSVDTLNEQLERLRRSP
jgi:hypothetical protein